MSDRLEREHELKVWPEYWDVLVSGEKTFEVRRDDRGFQRGDVLVLRRTHSNSRSEDTRFTPIRKRIKWILTGGQFGIEAGYVVMSLEEMLTSEREAQLREWFQDRGEDRPEVAILHELFDHIDALRRDLAESQATVKASKHSPYYEQVQETLASQPQSLERAQRLETLREAAAALTGDTEFHYYGCARYSGHLCSCVWVRDKERLKEAAEAVWGKPK